MKINPKIKGSMCAELHWSVLLKPTENETQTSEHFTCCEALYTREGHVRGPGSQHRHHAELKT